MKKAIKLSLFGVPGAGKGTQAELLTSFLSVPHISTGDMFRALQTGQSDLSKKIKAILDSGELVSDELVTEMTFARLGQSDCEDGFLLDGFPRTLSQAKSLQESAFAIDFLIEIKVERDEIVRRLSGRRVCPVCKATYHIDFLNSDLVCTAGHGKLFQREDDRSAAIEKRLNLFESNLAPVLGFYQEIGRFRSVEGAGQPKEVFQRILGALGFSDEE
ncbi:MAG: nucleoside monophosphate kinase [Myxococcales bacterium]|nr:MAG: nucleoside monophosphate kinase [Myxococcales bacterium]